VSCVVWFEQHYLVIKVCKEVRNGAKSCVGLLSLTNPCNIETNKRASDVYVDIVSGREHDVVVLNIAAGERKR
jgi:hypothetical protein